MFSPPMTILKLCCSALRILQNTFSELQHDIQIRVMHYPGKLKWKGTKSSTRTHITACAQARNTCIGSGMMRNYCCRKNFSASFVKHTKIYCSSRPLSHTIKTEWHLQKRNISSSYLSAYTALLPAVAVRLLSKSISSQPL